MTISRSFSYSYHIAEGLTLALPVVSLVVLLARPSLATSWPIAILIVWVVPALYYTWQRRVEAAGCAGRDIPPETIVNRVTDAIVEIDEEWRFTRVDDRAAEIYGRTEEELLGEYFWEEFPEALGTAFEEVYRGVMQSRKPDTLEAYNADLGGWFDAEIYPDDGGGLSFYFRDVGEAHALQEELQAERDLLKQSQRLVGAWAADLQTGELSWTDEVYRIHELAVGTPMDLEDAIEFYVPEARETMRRAFNRAANEGESFDLELPIYTARGNRRWLRTVGAPTRVEGKIVKVAGAVQDITQQRAAERESRLFASALEAAANAIAITDVEGVIQWVNPAFTDLTGYAASEASGQTMSILRSGEQDPGFYEKLWATITAGEVWHGRLINERKDGSRYVEEETITPVRDENGDIHHFIAVKQDVTAQQERETALRQAKEEAEQMNRLKSSFLANMSHEIRTPLTAIIGYADLLRVELASDTHRFVDHIATSGRRLLDTLNSVLDLAQLESGYMTATPELFDADEELRTVRDTLALKAEEQGIDLQYEWSGPKCVKMDRSILTRIVTNVLDNAIKFTDEGYARLSGRISGDDLIVEIEDTGIGMEEAFLENLYEAFRQESMGHSRQYEGSGLGLTITDHLVDLLGGSITVESDPGHGSQFTIRLPKTRAPTPELAGTEDIGTGDELPDLPRGLRVLTVDDDPAVAELLGEIFPEDYRCDRASSGDEALQRARESTYDLVLLDINLKDTVDGEELREQMERQGLLAGAMTVAITAYALPGDRERYLTAGFDGYIAKPFRSPAIIKTISELFNQGSAMAS